MFFSFLIYHFFINLQELITFGKKYPALISVIPLALGIFLSYYSAIDLSFLPAYIFISLIATLGILLFFLYKTAGKSLTFLYMYFILLVLFGFVSLQYRYFKSDDDNISRIVPPAGELKSAIRGVISERPEVNNDRVRFILNDVIVEGKKYSGDIIATIYKNRFKESTGSDFRYGDVIELTGKLESLPHRRNPGEFDYGEYLKLHEIDAVFTGFGFDKITLIGHEEVGFYKSNIIYPAREYSIRVIDEMIGGDEGEYLKGLVLGERSNISKELKENFINAGVAHIIAVSGLNVAYVIIILWGVLTFIPIKQSYKIFITIILLIFYMNLTGNTPSIIRATIMASVFLLARIIERKPNGFNIVSFAGLIILLIDPRQLFDAGFILSFSAIISIMIIYPVLDKWVRKIKWFNELDEKKIYAKAVRGITALFLGTLAAQLGTLPLTAIMFRKISIVSLFSNLFAIPLSNITLGLGFIMIIFSAISVWLASVFAALNSILMYLQLIMIEFCAKLDLSFVETYFVDWMMFVSYYIVLVILLTLKRENLKFRFIMLSLVIMNFVIWKEVTDKTRSAVITYLDAGNSNCTLIKMPQGTSILINAGSSTEKYTTAGRNVIPYIKTRGISEIDILVITSLNKNEFRNLKFLAQNFPVRKMLIPEYYRPVFENSDLSASFKGINMEYIRTSGIINRQGTFRLYLYYDSLYHGSSMMAQFTYGSQNFLFDDSKELYEDAVNTIMLPGDMKSSVLRTGTFDNTSAEFIIGSNPDNAIITTASGRKKPGSEIFRESLGHIGIKVHSPNEKGAVIFETDGVVTEKVDW